MRPDEPFKIAIITFGVEGQPKSGAELRLYQVSHLVERIALGRAVTWDLKQRGPARMHGVHANDGSNARATPVVTSSGLSRTLREFLAVLLNLWPWFVVSSLGAQREQILQWVAMERPTHVILVHPGATELLPRLRIMGIHVFVDVQNVESDLGRQLVRLSRSGREWMQAVLYWRTVARRERRYLPLAAEVWVPSAADATGIRRVSGNRVCVRVVRNALDLAGYTKRLTSGTHDLVFSAHFGYPPNVAAAEVLCTQILPKVRRAIGDARVVLVGRDPNGRAAALQRGQIVVATGEVSDVQPYLCQAGVVPVPILHGGGTRFKILEALALGLPVVTTPIGCEGLEVRNGEHLLIADIAGFPEAIVSLLRDPRVGAILGGKGRKLVESMYSWDAAEREMRGAFRDLPAGA